VPVAEVENAGLDSHFSSVPYTVNTAMIQCAGQRAPVENAGCYRSAAAKNAVTAKNGSCLMRGTVITNGSARNRAAGKSASGRVKSSGAPNQPTGITGAGRMKWNESGCGARRIHFIGSDKNAGSRLRYKISSLLLAGICHH
jgi:hypothetical protein